MADWMTGLGAGLQSFGGNALQALMQEQERKRQEAQQKAERARQDRQWNQQIEQFVFANNLTPAEAAGQIGKGRTTTLTFADGTPRSYVQRYEDTPEGRLETAARREQVKLDDAQRRALELEEKKAKLKNERAFKTLQRLGGVPTGITFEGAADEDWEGLLAQYREERLARIRKPSGETPAGTLSTITDEQGNVWQRNSRTGQLSPLMKPDGTPFKEQPKSGGTPTEAEMKAAGFGQRMLTANQTLEGMGKLGVDGQPSRTQSFLQAGGSILPDSWAEGTANALRSPEQQVYQNAVSDFINAFLRRDSGAAISKEEWARYAPMFTDRPDDSPQVKAQKAANRAATTQLMIKQAGKAWSPEIAGIASTASAQALAPWSQKGMVSPTQALQERKK